MGDHAATDDPIDDLRRCGASYRRFALDNPTYYSLMFDRAVPEFEPSDAAQAAAIDALGHLAADGAAGAWTPGRSPPPTPFDVAAGIWACEHGLVSLEMRKDADDPFDWDRIIPDTIDALLRGLAPPAG